MGCVRILRALRSSRADGAVPSCIGRACAAASVLNLVVALALYLAPIVLGHGWSVSTGPALLNIQPEPGRRYPVQQITAEPWGAAVVLEPAQSRLRQYILNADLPLWNPYQGLGQPYAAQAEGSPYAISAVVRALAPPWAGNLVTFAVFAIGAAAMFCMLRLLGVAAEAGLFGASVLFLSTSFTFNIARANFADQNAFLPIAFAAVVWAVQRPSWHSYLALAGATAATLFAGFIQTAVFTVVAASAFGAVLTLIKEAPWRERMATALGLSVAVCAGVAASGPHLFPIVEAANTGFHKNIAQWTQSPISLTSFAALFFPALFGEVFAASRLDGNTRLVDWSNVFATTSLAVLLLVLIGAFACRWGNRVHRVAYWFLSSLALVLLLRCVKVYPFSEIDRLPILGQQTAKHGQPLAAFLLLVAAALVLDQAPRWRTARVRWILAGFALVPIGVLAAAYAHGPPATRSIGATSLAMVAVAILMCTIIAAALSLFAGAPRQLQVMLAIVASAELCLYIPLGTSESSRLLSVRLLVPALWMAAGWLCLQGRLLVGYALAAASVLTYGLAVALANNGLPDLERARELPSFAEYLRRAAGEHDRTFGIFPDFSSQIPLRDIGVVGPFATSGFAAFVHAIDPEGALPFYGTSEFMLTGRRYFPTERYLRSKPLLDWVGVRFLVLEKRLLNDTTKGYLALAEQRQGDFRNAYEDPHVTIIESLAAKPRFEFSGERSILRSQAEIIRQLQADPEAIDARPRLESAQAASLPADATRGTGQVKLLEERPNLLRLSVESSGSGLVIVKTGYYPGWRAFVDGAEAPVLRVNAMVQGVPIAAGGNHIVELRYAPWSFTYGIVVAILAIVLFIATLIAGQRARAGDPKQFFVRLLQAFTGVACTIAVIATPLLFVERMPDTVSLVDDGPSTAIDLRGATLAYHEAYSTHGRQPFTIATYGYFPSVVRQNERLDLRVGGLAFLPDRGIVELDPRGRFRRVTAQEGQTVALVAPFASPDRPIARIEAIYVGGSWEVRGQ